MEIIHVIPDPCIFGPTIQSFAKDLGHDCFRYQLDNSLWKNAEDLFSLYATCKNNPGRLVLFHRVPHYWITALSIFVRDFHYGLLYWGEDYYATFLNEKHFEQHCIKKSPLLDPRNYRAYTGSLYKRFIREIRRYIGLKVVSGAEAILALTPKQFRLLKFFYLKTFRVPLRTPFTIFKGYSQDEDTSLISAYRKVDVNEMTVLICHSATESVSHEQSLEILKEYKKRWPVKIHVRGFLSYSGGDEYFRDVLEKKIIRKADFAQSIHFERNFLSLEEMADIFKNVDIALFSCLRDEGVGLLTYFVKMGGVVSFNLFSFNYDIFKYLYPGKLISHEKFLNMAPEQIYRKRGEPTGIPPSLLQYHEFGNIKFRTSKE